MEIAYHPPSARLAPLVSVYGSFVAEGSAQLLSLPSLLGQIHISLGGTGFYQFADGRVLPTPPIALCGPFNSAFRFLAPPDFRFVTVGLFASGWQRLARIPAHDLSDMVIDATCLWGQQPIQELLDRLHGKRLDGSHIPSIENFLIEAIGANDVEPDPYVALVDRWLETSSDLSLASLAADMDISQRQIMRVTRQWHGASPKLLSMKYRALRSATALAITNGEGIDAALESYWDQSHLIRDFRRFIGATPRQFLSEVSPMARSTIYQRCNAGIRRPLALWS